MQEIIAVVRQNCINRVKKSLIEAGFFSITAARAVGRGRRPVESELLQAVNEDPEIGTELLPTLSQGGRLFPKRLVYLVVPDDRKQEAVNILMQSCRTGEKGDGKIFVLPVTEALRLRTKEKNEQAIDEMRSPKEVS